MLGRLTRTVGEELEVYGVMPSAFAPDVSIDHGEIHLHGQAFGAVEHGCVMA